MACTVHSPALDLFLLFWSQDCLHLRSGRHADLSRLLSLLLGTESAVAFQACQLLLFVLKDRPDFLFLIVGEVKLLAESLQPMFGTVATHVLRTG